MNETIQKQITLYQQIRDATPDLSREEHIAILYETNKDMRTAQIAHNTHTNGDNITPNQRRFLEQLGVPNIDTIKTKQQASETITEWLNKK